MCFCALLFLFVFSSCIIGKANKIVLLFSQDHVDVLILRAISNHY